MSGFQKRDDSVVIAEFGLVILCQSTNDELSAALCCATIAASVPKIGSPEVRIELEAILGNQLLNIYFRL